MLVGGIGAGSRIVQGSDYRVERRRTRFRFTDSNQKLSDGRPNLADDLPSLAQTIYELYPLTLEELASPGMASLVGASQG